MRCSFALFFLLNSLLIIGQNQAINISQSIKIQDSKEQRDNLKVDNAESDSIKYIQIIINKEKQIKQLQFTHETEKKQYENLVIEQQEQTTEFKQKTNLVMGSLMVAILFLIYNSQRGKREKHHLFLDKGHEISNIKSNFIPGFLTKASAYYTIPVLPKKLMPRKKKLKQARKLLRDTYKKSGILKPKDISLNSMDEKFLNRLIESVELHMSNEKFGVTMLSSELGMSRSKLHRKLILILAQGPNKFIRTYRLQRSHELLKQNTATSSEISHQVGFGSPSYFTKCFHSHFGYTPSELKDRSIKR